jgi:hypothetical protein
MVFATVESRQPSPQVSFFQSSFPVSAGTMIALADGTLRATEMFRFAAPCEQSGCANWSGEHCRVAERLVQIMPVSSVELPACVLRPDCRWFFQEGGAACVRCSQVVTNGARFEEALNRRTTVAEMEAL